MLITDIVRCANGYRDYAQFSLWQCMHVGQTSRQLSTRLIKEHKHAVRSADFNASVLAEHAWYQHHPIDWDEATVLTSESNFHRRLTLESWYIHKSHQTLNMENGGFPVEYTLLMKKHACVVVFVFCLLYICYLFYFIYLLYYF